MVSPAAKKQARSAGLLFCSHFFSASSAARRLAVSSTAWQAMALPTVLATKPESALPGPISTTVSTPSEASLRMVSYMYTLSFT